jgi:hypothetical protein
MGPAAEEALIMPGNRRFFLALALFLPVAAAAAPLPFQGTIEIHISTLDTVGVFGSGVAEVGATPGSVHLTRVAFPEGVIAALRQNAPVTDPGAFPIAGLIFTVDNGPASFAVDASGGLSGPMPLRGVSKICLFGTCSAAVANIDVPLSVIGGSGAATAAAAVNVTVQGAPWTTGLVQVTPSSAVRGLARGPAGNTSSTAQLGGLLSLVTPIFISTNIAALSVVPAYGRFLQRFTNDAPPLCEVAVAQQQYGIGERVRFETIRYANPSDAELTTRLRLTLDYATAAAPFSILDAPAILPAGFDKNIGPVNAFTIAAGQPSGTYVLRCRIEESSGVLLAAAQAHFEVNAFPAP